MRPETKRSADLSRRLRAIAVELDAVAAELYESYDWTASKSMKDASKELYRLAAVNARPDQRLHRSSTRTRHRQPITPWG